MFLTFEGIEGSGKSTQIKLLAGALKAMGKSVILTREPGGTRIGDDIRKILLDSANNDMAYGCEVLLYWAARAQHVSELIQPSLQNGQIVLCDRFVDSTLAYQGFARGIDFTTLATLEKMVCGSLKPHKTFLFDLPVEQGLARAKNRIAGKLAHEKEDRFENELVDFHEKVRAGFLTLAGKEPSRFVILDATQDVQTLHTQVLQNVKAFLKNA